MSAQIIELDGRLILTYTGSDGAFYRLGSAYHADYYQRIWAESHLSDYRHAVYLVFGLGDGSYLQELIRVADSDSLFIVYEPDSDIYETAAKAFALDSLAERDNVIIIHNAAVSEFKDIINRRVSSVAFIGMRICVYPNYNRIFASEYDSFCEAVESVRYSKSSSQRTIANNGRIAIYNILNNFKVLAHSQSITALKDIVSPDIPVIICGAGPSLNDAIPHLPTVKGRALILCVDSALPALLKHDIIPDLMISVDPIKEDFNFKDPRVKNIPGVFPMPCRNFIFDGRTAPSFFYNCAGSIAALFADTYGIELPDLKATSSVGNHAYAVAEYLGSRTIILTGIDMAYKNNRTHADGTLLENQDSSTLPCQTMVKGVDGSMLASDLSMNMYRTQLEERIVQNTAVTINTSSCGAAFSGTIQMPFEEALDKYCPVPAQADFSLYAPLNLDLSVFFGEFRNILENFTNDTEFILTRLNDLKSARSISESEADILIPACDEMLQKILCFPVQLSVLYASLCEFNAQYNTIFKKDTPDAVVSGYISIFEALLKGVDYLKELETF